MPTRHKTGEKPTDGQADRFKQTVYISRNLASRLRVHCGITLRSISDVTEDALEAYLKAHPTKLPKAGK